MSTPVSDDRSFKVGPRSFKLNKIDAFQQFHIVRRIGPLLSELFPVFAQIKTTNVDSLSEEKKLEEFAKIAKPLMDGLARLTDSDADYVLFRLLSSVEVLQPEFNTWARIATNNGIMIQDIDLPVLIQAAGRALVYNLAGFLALPRPK